MGGFGSGREPKDRGPNDKLTIDDSGLKPARPETHPLRNTVDGKEFLNSGSTFDGGERAKCKPPICLWHGDATFLPSRGRPQAARCQNAARYAAGGRRHASRWLGRLISRPRAGFPAYGPTAKPDKIDFPIQGLDSLPRGQPRSLMRLIFHTRAGFPASGPGCFGARGKT